LEGNVGEARREQGSRIGKRVVVAVLAVAAEERGEQRKQR
jgi:hypothetical protein